MGAGSGVGNARSLAHDSAQAREAATKLRGDRMSRFISMKGMPEFEMKIKEVAKISIAEKQAIREQSIQKEEELKKILGDAAKFKRIKTEIDKEIESIRDEEKASFANIDKAFQGNFMNEVKVTDYISITGLSKKRMYALMQSPVQAVGGIAMLGLGGLSVLNEVGAILNNAGTAASNLAVTAVGVVLIGYGARLLRACGLVPAVMKAVMDTKPTDIPKE